MGALPQREIISIALTAKQERHGSGHHHPDRGRIEPDHRYRLVKAYRDAEGIETIRVIWDGYDVAELCRTFASARYGRFPWWKRLPGAGTALIYFQMWMKSGWVECEDPRYA